MRDVYVISGQSLDMDVYYLYKEEDMTMKKTFVCAAALTFLCSMGVAGISLALDKGSSEMVLKSTVDPAKKEKPALFPHAQHQKAFICGTCHHSQNTDGTQATYKDGQKIEQCDACHNTTSGMITSLNTFKKAAHTLCIGCHKELKASAETTGPTKCNGCHQKNLK